MMLGALIAGFLILKFLLKNTNKKGFIFWYSGTGIIYALLLLLVTEGSTGFQELLPPSFRKIFELTFVTVAFMGMWSIIIIAMLPLTFLIGTGLFSNTHIEMETVFYLIFFLYIPQLCSYLIIRILNAKGFFERKKDMKNYEEQNERKEKSAFH